MEFTPAFLPGKSQGQRRLAGYSPWCHRVGHDRSNLACMHELNKYIKRKRCHKSIFFSNVYVTVHCICWNNKKKKGKKSILNTQGQRNNKIKQDTNTMKYYIPTVRNTYNESLELWWPIVESFTHKWLSTLAFKWIKIKQDKTSVPQLH